jgi:hypothetical protein
MISAAATTALTDTRGATRGGWPPRAFDGAATAKADAATADGESRPDGDLRKSAFPAIPSKPGTQKKFDRSASHPVNFLVSLNFFIPQRWTDELRG